MIRARDVELSRPQETATSADFVVVDAQERMRMAIELMRRPDDRQFYDYFQAMPKSARDALLAAGSEQGAPLIVGAAMENRISKLAILAHFGASMTQADPRGMTALYAALSHGAAVALHGILKNPKLLDASIDPIRLTGPGIERVFVTALPNRKHETRDQFLDRVTVSIFGPALELDQGDELMRYFAHTRAWQNGNGKQLKQNEGWHPLLFLPHRVRTLFGMYAEADVATRRPLAKEIAATVEAARLADRFNDIDLHGGPYREQLIRHECRAAAKRIESLGGDHAAGVNQYIVPMGVPSNGRHMGHSAYVTFEHDPEKGVITFRLDNLGNGADYYHRHSRKNLVYPMVLDFPATPESIPVIEQLLFDLMSIRADGRISDIYDAISLATTRVLTESGVMITVDPEADHTPSLSQATGNCVYENFHASCMHRLGRELADAIRIFESQDVQRRAMASFSQSAITEANEAADAHIMSRSAE